MPFNKDALDRIKQLNDIANDGRFTGEQLTTLFKNLLRFVEQTARGLQKWNEQQFADLKRDVTAKLLAVRNGRDGKDGAPGAKGDKGDRGEPGPRGERGPAGKDGRDADTQAINETLEDFEKRLSETAPRGVFIGPSRGVFLYIGGVKKGLVSNLNIIGSGGVTAAYSKVNGQDTLTLTANGGGLTVETPTGSVNASNTEFTVTAEPQWIVADGTTYYAGAGYTYNALTVTMDVPPSSYIRAII